MAKAILVIDRMPLSCNVCRLRAYDENLGEYCTAHRPHRIQEYMDESIRADWCPLMPMPEKIPQKIREQMLTDCGGNLTQMVADGALAVGWNACLKAIGGDEDE